MAQLPDVDELDQAASQVCIDRVVSILISGITRSPRFQASWSYDSRVLP